MISERRKKLAALSFSEKIKILEKLRDRSLAISASRKQLANAKNQDEAEKKKD